MDIQAFIDIQVEKHNLLPITYDPGVNKDDPEGDQSVNAFYSHRRRIIMVSPKLIELMTPGELKGILLHEIGHSQRNKDHSDNGREGKYEEFMCDRFAIDNGCQVDDFVTMLVKLSRSQPGNEGLNLVGQYHPTMKNRIISILTYKPVLQRHAWA